MDYKEYLDKARIKQLAELQARYNQVYAKERAEAASSLIAGHRQLRRGLQNVGLAGRKGNLISGREKTAALEARRRYREYNAGLSRAANTFTTAAGQRMARQAIDDENRAKRAEAYAKWGDEYAAAKAEAEKEYAAKLEEAKQEHLQYAQEYQNSYNALAQQAQYQAWLQQQAAAQAAQQSAQQELIDPRFQGNNMQQQKQDLLAARADQQRLQMQQMAQNGVDPRQNAAFNTQQGKVNYVSALAAARQQAVENELRNNDIDPRFAQNSVMQQTKPQASAIAASRRDEAVRAQYEQNLNEWRDKIQRAEGITKPKTRNEYDKWHEAQVARQQMIDYERRVTALKYPAISNLITLSDSEFAMRYDAAEKAYKHAVQDAQILRKDSSSSMDDLSSEANGIEAKATAEFVKWQNAARARDDAMGAFYNESVNTNMKLVPHAPTWASEKDHDGKNYTAAMQNHWDATQYARSHDTDGSKYMPLVNEWSFINGRTALNYTQTHAVSNFVNNTASGGKKTQQYNAFVANCAAAFYNQPEGLTKSEREKMEAMLTLANLMTDEERARFNTILRQGGGKEADKYFEYLYASVLPQRFDSYVNNEMEFQTRDGIGKVFESVISIPVNLAQGVSGVIHTLSTGQEDPIAAKLAATKYNLAQGARDAVGQGISSSITNALMNAGTAEDFAQWAGSAGNFLYGTGMSMADSATVAAISAGIGSVFQGAGLAAETASKIGSAIGGSLLGASAFNSSYQEALDNGLDPQKARITAIGNGFNEMLFETLSIGTLLEKTGKSVIKVGKSAFVNWLVNTAVQAGVEGSEEVFTDIGNKIWDNRINGIFSEEMQKIREYVASGMSFNEAKEKVRREFAEQLGMSFLGGAISGGFMGGGAQFVNMISNRQLEAYGKTLSQERIDELKKYEYKSEQAQEILNSDKITNTDAAMLDIIHTQELVQESIDYVEQAVAEGKMPQEIADIYKKFAEHNVQTETNPDGITDEEAEKMLPYVDTIKNAEAIKQGLGKIVEQQTAARKEFDALSPEQKQQRLQNITNETTALRNAPSLRVGASESRLSGQSAAQEFTTRAKTDTITLNNDGSVKTANGSVTFDFGANKTVDAMTDNQARAIRFAAAVANKTGVNIKVEQEFVGDDRNKNGEYNPETNTIRVNLSGTNSAIYTMSHELTHYLQSNNKQAFADLSKAIQKQLSRTDLVGSDLPADYQDIIGDYLTGDNTLFEALCAYEKERYAKEKINLTQEKVEEEVIARCCESFLGNSSLIADMTQNHTKSARAVYRFLNEIRADINALRADASERMAERGYASDFSPEQGMLEQFADIDKIVKLWENGLRKVAKKNKVSGEKMASLSDTEYLDLAKRYESGDKSVEAELRKAVDAAAERAMRDSKIRMPDGKLRKLYHGTYSDEFNVFDKSLIGTAREGDTGFFGRGFYFAYSKDEASMYGRRVIDAYVNITNPFNFQVELTTMNGERALDYNGGRAVFVTNFAEKFPELAKYQTVGTYTKDGEYKQISFAQFAKDFRNVYDNVKFNVKEVKGEFGKEWLVLAGEQEESYTNENGETFKWKEYAYQRRYMDERSASDKAANAYEYLKKTKYNAWLPGAPEVIMDTAFSATLIERGYDGVIQSEYGDEVVAFESSQIKKSDPVVYDDNGNIIPLSERFKTENEDIRYSIGVADSVLGKNSAVPTREQIESGDATYGGLPVIYKANQRADASNWTTEIHVGDKFFEYSEDEQRHILNHEIAHNLSDELMDQHQEDWNEFAAKFVKEKAVPVGSKAYENGRRTYWEGLYGDIGATSLSETLTHAITEYLDNPARLRSRSAEAYAEIDAFMKNRMNDEVITNNSGDPVMKVTDNGNSTMLSLSTYEKDGRATLKDWLKKQQSKKRISKEDAQYIIDQMEKVYNIATKYEDKYAAFGAWSRAEVTRDKFGKPVFSVIRANGEYPMNLDFSLVCVKRRALDAVLNEIVKSGYMDKLVLDGEALVKVNETIRRHGFETACMGCFVEAKRFRQQGVAETFVGKYNDLVKSLGRDDVSHFNFAKDETITDSEGIVNVPDKELDFTRINELVNQYKAKKKANPSAGQTVEEAIAMELKMNPSSRRLVDVGDFMSTRGMDAVAKDAPSVLTLYNKQKGTGGPKAVFGDMQYLNDVERRYQWTPAKAYKVGGVRVQSFSDFVPRMFFDYCQMVADLSAKKLPAHAYTKEESFVKLFGLTGMKINMSLFPKIANDGLAAGLMYKRSADGDIVFENGEPVITYAWAGESFDYETAKQIQADAKYGKNCGTIAVGISDEHIARMLDDPTIRMIIPYHKSSLNPVVAEMMGIDGFTDYTDQQRTKKDGKAIDVDFAFNQRLHEVGDPKAVVKEYLAWCEKNGYTPKFEQFKGNENYYKLLEDFALYDEQGNYCAQEAVKMVYPEQGDAFGSMDTLLDEYLKRDNDLQEARDAMVPILAQEIIRQTDKKASLAVPDKIKLSSSDGTRTFTYGDVTAKMYGNDVTLDGGKVRQRVQMLQVLAERYDHVTVDASSEAEARAFENAGAKRVADEFSTGNEYGTYEFKFVESQFKRDSQFDAKQKANFAKEVLKQVGSRRNFTDQQMVKYRAALERAMTYLWNSTYGKGDQMVAYDAVDRLFDQILNGYSMMTEADANMRDALMSQMRKLKTANGRTYYQLDVTETQMSEILHKHDNVKTYTNLLSKALGARVVVKQVDGAKMLENTFTHATDSRIKNDTVEGDMPGELLRLAQDTMEKRTNPYKSESNERATKKEAMWDAALNIIGGEKSTQQKIRDAVKEARASERKAAKDKTAKAVDEARLAERMHEGALRAKDRRVMAERESDLKRRSVDREARLKQQFRETTARTNEERLKRDMRKVALKWNQRLVKLLANPTEASHVPVQLAREVAELTKTITEYIDSGTERGRINLEKIAKAYQQAFDDQATIRAAKEENRKYDPRGSVIDREMYDEQLVNMIDEMNEILADKSFKELSAREMMGLLNIIRGVAHTVYDANRMIGTTERKAIWQVGDQMVKELESAPKIKGGFARFFLEESLDLRRIAKVFSGSNENAEFVKLSDMLNHGAIEKERVAQVLSGMFDQLTKDYGDEIRKWYGKNAEWIDTGITKNGRKVEITKGMRVSLAMHVLNAGNMRHIENGGVTIPNRELYAKGKLADAYANGTLVRLNSDQINTIISQMTEAEKAYVEVAKEFFHQRTGYYVNKTSLQLLGYRKATVENYFPIHTDRNYTKTDFASVVRDGSIEGQGFLKERVMASNPVYLEDITSVVNRQIKGVSLYAGLAVPMRNFNAVMNASVYEDENGNWVPRTTVRKAMTQSMGEYGAKVVQGFLQDVSGMSAVDVTPGEQLVAKLQTRYVKAVLLANLKVTLKQAASYPTAAAVIPWKYLSKALLKGGRNKRLISRADVDLINQYTPLYKMRLDGMANEITSIMAERGLEQKMPWLLGWITKMDVATVGRLWSAAEYMVADQQNLPVGSDEYYKAVAEVFNQTIQQTQPNFTPLQRNAALRSKNPVVRTLTLFGTQRMQNGGILIESAMELAHSKNMSKEAQAAAKAKFGRAVVSQLVQNVMLVAIGFVVDALRGRMTAWQDDDKDVTLESVAQVMGDQFLGNIFGSFLGGSEAWDIISTAFKRATNANAYDTEFTVPSLDAIETIIGFFNKDSVSFVQYMSGNHTAEEKIARLKSFSFKVAKAAGYLTGFPFENIAKTIVKGWIPALQDIKDYADTGELIPWLHQSGKLDKARTAANYKAWTKAGYSGRDYFYWEKQLNGVSGGRDGRITILLDSDLTNEQKALMMQMFDTADGYADGTVFYNKKGEAIIDFTAPSEKQQALPKPSAEPSEAPNAEPTAEPTPKPTENPLTEARQEGVQAAMKLGVPEQTAFDAFLAYQNMGKNKDESDGYSRNDEFREWLFKNVDDPHQKAVLEYQVIGQASSVKGAITYRDSGVVYRDYTNESWFKLSEHNLSKDGTNKRYEAGKQLEKTGLKVDKTVAIYDGLKELTKKAEWIDYLKGQNLNDDQIRIFLWSRGWKY